MKTKKLMAAVAVALTLCVTIGGTLAWLTDETKSKVNTFTVGNVDIGLEETTEDYKMVPGTAIEKDPTVTVEAGSEECWLFVKVEKSANLDSFITYTIADGWTSLEGVDGVYYREVTASDSKQEFGVLTGDQVTVKGEEVTKEMMDAIKTGTVQNPTLTFTAYAIQKSGFKTAAAAWTEVSK